MKADLYASEEERDKEEIEGEPHPMGGRGGTAHVFILFSEVFDLDRDSINLFLSFAFCPCPTIPMPFWAVQGHAVLGFTRKNMPL